MIHLALLRAGAAITRSMAPQGLEMGRPGRQVSLPELVHSEDVSEDTAIEAADIALMADDLSKLPWLLTHSRRMLSIIRTNIILSLAVKAVFVALPVSPSDL